MPLESSTPLGTTMIYNPTTGATEVCWSVLEGQEAQAYELDYWDGTKWVPHDNQFGRLIPDSAPREILKDSVDVWTIGETKDYISSSLTSWMDYHILNYQHGAGGGTSDYARALIDTRDTSLLIWGWTGTQEQFDAIVTKDSRTIYVVTDGEGQTLVLNNNAPVSATDPGSPGDVRWDTGFVYVCVATDTWKRAALSTWPL